MNDGNRLLFERIFQNAEFVRSLGIQLTSFGKGWCETSLCPAMVERPVSADYLDRIIAPAREYGFPAWYIERLEKFRT
jgi:hypothetical protein